MTTEVKEEVPLELTSKYKLSFNIVYNYKNNYNSIEVKGGIHYSGCDFITTTARLNEHYLSSDAFFNKVLEALNKKYTILHLKHYFEDVNITPDRNTIGTPNLKLSAGNSDHYFPEAWGTNGYLHVVFEEFEIAIGFQTSQLPLSSVDVKKSTLPIGIKKAFTINKELSFEEYLIGSIVSTDIDNFYEFVEEVNQLFVEHSTHLPKVQTPKEASINTLFIDPRGNLNLIDSFKANYNPNFPISYEDFEIGGATFSPREFSDLVETYMKMEKTQGALYLRGEPGTGKTYFINHLSHFLSKSCIVLKVNVSDFIGIFSQVNTFSYLKNLIESERAGMLKQYPLVFIIEDTEKLVVGNTHERKEFQSLLLNYISGAEADALQCKFIFTLNCETADIDPAFIRCGRMIFNQVVDFKKLNKEKAILLAMNINGNMTEEQVIERYDKYLSQEGCTLAEVYEIFKPESSKNILDELAKRLKGTGIAEKLNAKIFEELAQEELLKGIEDILNKKEDSEIESEPK